MCGIDFVCFCFATRQYNCSWNNTINQCQIFACGKKHGYFDSLLGLQMHTHTHTHFYSHLERERARKKKRINICLRERECVCVCNSLADRFSISHRQPIFLHSNTILITILTVTFPSDYLRYHMRSRFALFSSRYLHCVDSTLFFLFFHIRHNNL